jgi:glycosyltransferase involved in cell wall biosynthesis
MRRIAYCSPVNPVASGISDYSEELIPYLGQYAEVVVYVDDGVRPTNAALRQSVEIRPISRYPRDQHRRRYDATLYHMGNSAAHLAIWHTARQHPGVIVLHDFVLHHFMLQYLVTHQRTPAAYRAQAHQRYGAAGTRVAELMLHGRFTEAAFSMPFCDDVVAAADGIVCHSAYVAQRVAALRPTAPLAVVPMGVPPAPVVDRTAARHALGLRDTTLVLASFGHINPYKRTDVVLRALRTLLAEGRDIHYLLVGSISPHYDVHRAVARAGLGDHVTITGYVARDAFATALAAADVCINLRHPTAGETSASLLRLLGAGKPTLVTATGSFTELPAAAAAHVDLDESELELVCAYCRVLADQPALARAMAAAARRYVAEAHTLPGAARAMMQFLAQRYGWEPPAPHRDAPLWSLDAGAIVPQAASRPVATGAAPSLLAGSAAAAAATLGFGPDDDAALARIAAAVVELAHTRT